MEWQNIMATAGAIVASVGGSGIIICAVANYLSSKIADRLQAKYQLTLNKELERHKTTLSTKEYISKAKFDREFAMYQELSEKNITMVYDAGQAVLIARGLYDDLDEVNAFIQKFCNDLNDAENANKRFAPFIAKSVFEQYRTLENQASEIFSLLKTWKSFKIGDFPSKIVIAHKDNTKVEMTLKSTVKQIEEKQKELSSLSDSTIELLREYLSTREVID